MYLADNMVLGGSFVFCLAGHIHGIVFTAAYLIIVWHAFINHQRRWTGSFGQTIRKKSICWALSIDRVSTAIVTNLPHHTSSCGSFVRTFLFDRSIFLARCSGFTVFFSPHTSVWSLQFASAHCSNENRMRQSNKASRMGQRNWWVWNVITVFWPGFFYPIYMGFASRFILSGLLMTKTINLRSDHRTDFNWTAYVNATRCTKLRRKNHQPNGIPWRRIFLAPFARS